MKTFAARRGRNLILLLTAAAAVLLYDALWAVALRPTAFLTGWTLGGLVVFLALYNVRKRVPVLPLLSSATWLQIHIYVGMLSCVVFFAHIGFRIPNGGFEGVLAALYLLVFLSGVGGLILSRVIPARLTGRGEEVLYERIPVHLKKLRDEVEALVFGCISETDTTAIPQFYVERLQPFFERPRNFWRHVVHSPRPRRELLIELDDQRRFLNDKEREVLEKIRGLILQKDDLDYHFALQTVLKYWLFVHIPLTYALLVFMAFHAAAALAFAGGGG